MRLKIFFVTIILCFILLLYGLFYTQIVKGSYYQERSEDNRIVGVPLEAPRGKMFDRNGKTLVDNRISFDVAVVYKDAKNFAKLATFLSDILKVDCTHLMSALERAKERPFTPTVILEDIGKTNAIILEQKKIDYPGLMISTRPRRDYIYGEVASAFTGYLGMISEDELTRFRRYGYTIKDLIGRSGLEKKYDHYLRGVQGGMQLETDSLGRQKKMLYAKEPEVGKSLYLTIDIDLQSYCDEAMGKRKGSIIVMNPQNGEILAFISKPAFDPNIFVMPDKLKNVRDILKYIQGDYPPLNRGVSCAYPPGSIFKVVVGVAALETGRFSRDATLGCSGTFSLGKSVFRCWREKGHGAQVIVDAIKHSCNVFFYQLGLRAGVNDIFLYADKFGFGNPTGIDLPGEIRGLLPSIRWKRANKKEAWYPGDTVNYSIGQGFLLVTPIQVVRMMAAVANGGYLVAPYIVDKIDIVDIANPKLEKIEVSEEVLETIKNGLVKVVNDPRGTGMKARLKDVIIAGKTGTAQNPADKAHGWFSGFAPSENPKVCLVVFVEFGGKGGVEASKIAQGVFAKSRELGLL